MKLLHWAVFSALMCLSSNLAFSQGASCSAAQPLAGLGSFPFDTSAGGSTGFGGSTQCNPLTTLHNEGYFQWQATSPGDVRFEFDSPPNTGHLAIFSGMGCGSVCLDAERQFQSNLTNVAYVDVAGVQAGDTFLVQIAGYQPGAIQGNLRIDWQPCDPVHSQDDNFAPNATCATAAVLSPGLHVGLWVDSQASDFFRIQVPALHEVSLELLPSFGLVFPRRFEGDCTPLSGFNNLWQVSNYTSQPEEIVLEVYPWLNIGCSTYDLQLIVAPVPCAPASGSDDGMEENDVCSNAAPVTAGTYTSLFATSTDPDFYSVDVQPGERLQVQLLGAQSQMAPKLYDESCQGLGFFQSEWTNWTDQVQRRVIGVQPPMVGTPLCWSYDMVISIAPDPCTNLGPDVFGEGFNDREYADGYYPGLFLGSWVQQDLCVAPGETLTIDLELVDPNGILEAELRCASSDFSCLFGLTPPLATGSGQQVSLTWTNNTGLDAPVELGVSFQFGTLYCNQFNMTISGAGGCSASLQTADFCPPSNPNSSGFAAKLMGTRRNASQSLYLDAVQGPVGQFGYMLVGTAAQSPGTPLGAGELCLSATGSNRLGRYNQSGSALNSIGRFDSLGRFVNQVGTSTGEFGFDVPQVTPWLSPILSGQTLYFQMWHRDVNATSNLSNGVEVTF